MATVTTARRHDLFTRNNTSSGSEIGQSRFVNGGSFSIGVRNRSRTRDGNQNTAANSSAITNNNSNPTSSNSVPPSFIYQGSMEQPRMYVRALYSFKSDDPTSLSFSQGDMIQVLTQLESGWWDGIVHGQRGWFPSNYCMVVVNSEYQGNGVGISPLDDSDTEDGSSGDSGDDDDSDRDGVGSPKLPMEGTDDRDADEAAFWIPQATPDGRLYYFNTITGDSRMELPLETPTSTTESGPRDRSNISAPDQSRPPPEMMARGYEREDAGSDDAGSTTSDHDGEPLYISRENADVTRQSFISEDSSTKSIRSRHSGSFPADNQSEKTLVESVGSGSASIMSQATIVNNSSPPVENGAVLRTPEQQQTPPKPSSPKPHTATFYNDGIPLPTSWDSLIEDTKLTIERYCDAVEKREKTNYVRRAEDISDMLRLLIAANSSTTDNHSGQPSIISTNRPLYPHFRGLMAAFSKLILSSHIASGDFPPPDTESNCLAEAEKVLLNVHRFAEVARTQRRDTLPRFKPGFVVGSNINEGWRNLPTAETHLGSPIDHDSHNGVNQQLVPVDNKLVERLEELSNTVRSALRRLEVTLDTSDTMTTPYSQSILGGFVINAAHEVVDALRAYFHFVERFDLQPFTASPRSPSYDDLINQKQRLFDSSADLIMACQAITAPLADEWMFNRGEPLDERLNNVRLFIQEIQNGVQTLNFPVGLLVGENDIRQPHNPEVREERDPAGLLDSPGPAPGPGRIRIHSVSDGGQNGSNKKLFGYFGIVPPTPWFLGCDYDHEIVYGKKKTDVKGGTLPALIERLTRHDILDTSFIMTFLLTYQSFTNAKDLFELLTQRFTIQPPLNLTTPEFEMWVEKKQKLIRVRVLSVLKQWLESYWMENDDEAGKDLLKKIYTFAKDVMLQHLAGTQKLMEVVESRMRGHAPDKRIVQNLGTAPQPILPRNMKKLKFLDIDALEFARQLTIIESRAYRKLKPTDCMNKAWSKQGNSSDGSEPASNVRNIILHSNQLTNWVAEMILTQLEVRRRVIVIKHFIAVAEKCRQLNNFSTLTSIISALGAAPIHRLKRTWDNVPQRPAAILENMKVLMGTTLNFNEYRECLHLVDPPCVPFLGVYLKDLTFVADGNSDFIKGTDLINFGKRSKTATIIREIQQYQSVPYPLQPVPELQEYILSNMQAAKDVTEMFDLSLQREPREREDEKIARWVHL